MAGITQAAGQASLDWSRSVWPSNVTFSDGSSVSVGQRERPHMVFDGGKLVALSSGFRDENPDRTWTLVQGTVNDAAIQLKTDDARRALDDDFHCQSHSDCSLNGLCGVKNLGKCECDRPWTGAQCGELRFKPMTAAGSDLYTASKLNNSWGGTLVAGLDGKFYSFVSVYPPDSLWGNNCSIGVAARPALQI